MTDRLLLAFVPREAPLLPCAVAAFDQAAIRLASHLLAGRDETFAELEGVATEGIILILGAESKLPWVDGVVYLGAEPENAGLLYPTTLSANVPSAWMRTLAMRAGGTLPLALVPRDGSVEVLPFGEARPLERARLEAFLEGWT